LFDLHGAVVMATGGNSGIGLAFLTGCARQGADVVIWDRDESRHAEAGDILTQAGAGRVHIETVDVSDEASVVAAMTSTLNAVGKLDCVLANAGFTTRAPSFIDMPSEMYHQLLNVNLHGAFYTL
jgi:NAD(P)-dependent dehydrogenase (short-subunit alcohol dehydrogenase family)